MAQYIDSPALVRLIKKYRRSKKAGGDELGRALLAIAGGVWDRFRFTSDRDDYCQDAVLHLLQQPLKNANLTKNLFNYFTTCAVRYGQKLRAKEAVDRRRFETYCEELAESGQLIPGDE